MPEALDWAKFDLQRMTAMVDAKTKLMKAYADYNYRMMEVLEKRIKVETDFLKLQIMQDAFVDFRRARMQLLREQRKVEQRLTRIARHVKQVRNLGRGETLPPTLVTFVWIGFKALLQDIPIDVHLDLAQLEVTDEHRNGDHFTHNLHPDEQCESAPDDVRHVAPLTDFLRVRSYMPRLGSPPFFLFAEVVTILEDNADQRATSLESQLQAVESELADLRSAHWETIDIDRSPKDVEDAEDEGATI